MDEEEKRNGENLIDFIRLSKKRTSVEIIIPSKKNIAERKAVLGVYYEKIKVRAPQRLHQKRGQNLNLTVLRLFENLKPKEGEQLEWILITNLEIEDDQDACTKALWYKQRWHIENYHKVLKSKCKIENCRLITADRLQTFISMKSIIAFRIYFLTHISRVEPETPCTAILEEHEWKALYMKINRRPPPKKSITIKEASILIAKRGGYLNRNSDPPPGLIVIGRGLERLKEISDNYLIFVGNS